MPRPPPQQEQTLIASLAQSGADVVELATDDDLLDALMRFADLRRQRARLKTPLRFPATMRRASALPAVSPAALETRA